MEPDALTHILTFLGYGNPGARLWFLGGEEGFGGRMSEEERIASLEARALWAPVRDMHEAHLEFTEGGIPIDISKPRAGSIAVWRWMARIALGLQGNTYEQARSGDRSYVFNKLGRSNGATFLTEASPIPCVTANLPHPLVAGLTERSQDARRKALQEHWRETRPLTICYGIGRREAYSSLLDLNWTPLHQFDGRVLFDRKNRAFLLPFFGQGQMSHALMERFIVNDELLSAWSNAGAVTS